MANKNIIRDEKGRFINGGIPFNKKLELDSNKLISFYTIKHLNITEIAKILKCGKTTVYRKLIENNINTSQKGKKHSEEHVRKGVQIRKDNGSYHNPNKNKTWEETYGEEKAKEMRFKLSQTLKQLYSDGKIELFNIERKGLQSKLKGKFKTVIDKDSLIDLYINQKKSSIECAKIFNCAHSTITKRLRFYGIKIRSHSDIRGELHPLFHKERSEKHKNNLSKSLKGREVWNIGLTNETDERVKLNSIKKGLTLKRLASEGKIKNLFQKGEKKSPEMIKKISLKNKGKHYSPQTEFKKGDLRISGENNNHFNNWSSFEPYTKDFNNRFKNQIKQRDNQVCMNCGVHREKLKKALDSHHVNYDKLLSIPENCISLCHSCHSLTNINRPYWIKLFQEKLARLYGYQYSETGEVILKLINDIQDKFQEVK